MQVSSIRHSLRGLVLLVGLGTFLLPAQAQDLAHGSETARRAIHVCASCHGEGGRSTNAAYPKLAGQSAMYTVRQLTDFRAQKRSETDSKAYMWGVSALLDDETIQSLADYYAAQTPDRGHAKGSAAELARGRKLFAEGAPARGVRACATCHGVNAEGAAGFPRLAGPARGVPAAPAQSVWNRFAAPRRADEERDRQHDGGRDARCGAVPAVAVVD